jgi:hypothetical protein
VFFMGFVGLSVNMDLNTDRVVGSWCLVKRENGEWWWGRKGWQRYGQFNGVQVNRSNTKIVFKPVSADSKWKIICEPKHGDLRLLTKKIPLGPLLSLQVSL